MGSKAPDPPDLGPMAEGSMESARIAQETAMEQLAWAREQDSLNRDLLDRVLTSQEQIQSETADNARTDRERYEQIYQPLEDNLVQEFQNYDTPERRQEERGRAIADVNSSFDAQRRNALQRLESYGVDPSQTRNAALDIGMRTQQAAAAAGAASAADRATEQTGRALRAEALNIGKGYPSNVAGSYGQSLAAGNSMVGNANQTTSTSGNAAQGANSYLNTSISGFGQAGNTATQGYQNQMAQFNANQQATTGALSAIGGIAGMFMADGGSLEVDENGETMYRSKPGKIDYGEGDGSGIDDQVPIMASTEEYIIPADVVRAKGVEFFDKLVAKYHTPADEQREEMGMDPHTENVASGKALNPTPKADGGQPWQRPTTEQLAARRINAPQTFTWNGQTRIRNPNATPPKGMGRLGESMRGLMGQVMQQYNAQPPVHPTGSRAWLEQQAAQQQSQPRTVSWNGQQRALPTSPPQNMGNVGSAIKQAAVQQAAPVLNTNPVPTNTGATRYAPRNRALMY